MLHVCFILLPANIADVCLPHHDLPFVLRQGGNVDFPVRCLGCACATEDKGARIRGIMEPAADSVVAQVAPGEFTLVGATAQAAWR